MGNFKNYSFEEVHIYDEEIHFDDLLKYYNTDYPEFENDIKQIMDHFYENTVEVLLNVYGFEVELTEYNCGILDTICADFEYYLNKNL